jgi:putative peptide zinc metalloprotease protein
VNKNGLVDMKSNLQDIFLASSRRPLQLKMRCDLVAKRQDYMGRRYWVVKDPLNLEYFRFEEEEYFLLSSLDGKISLEELQERFEQKYAPQKIALAELHRFLGTIHKSCLATSPSAGQGETLASRNREKVAKRRKQAATNILGFRIRGIDPDRMLTQLGRWLGFFFTLPCVIAVLLLGLSALLLVGTQYETFARRLPDFKQFFAMENWLWLAGTLAVTKVLHEFGHGLACKRLGGECHELGIMLLVFTPCLYCNVSDSWMLNNKWHRAAIAAAGMYVECFLAALATWIWWYSVPGVVHYLALNVMFVCSISTLMFNANPLMRYDGYYILSDIAEIPNLRQKATKVFQNWAKLWCLGIAPADDPFLPHRNRWLFAMYSIAAVIYRWVITLSILWFLNQIFEPYGLQILGRGIAAISLFSLIVLPLWKLARFMTEGIKMRRFQNTRLTATSLVVVGACLLLFIPLPFYVECPIQLELRDDEPIYVEIAGTLEEVLVQHGQTIQVGDPVARVENASVQLALLILEARQKRLGEDWNTLQILALDDPLAASRLREVRSELDNIVGQIEQRQKEIDKLTLAAPRSGVLFPVSYRPRNPDQAVLPRWSGQPLTSQNLGAHLSKGLRIGTVGDPHQLRAVLTIDQGDIPFVAAGQAVSLVLDQYPTQLLKTQIDVVGRRNTRSEKSDQQAASQSTVTDERDPNGDSKTRYFASASLDVDDFVAPAGTGTARIAVGKRTLFSRMCRAISRTFRFEL